MRKLSYLALIAGALLLVAGCSCDDDDNGGAGSGGEGGAGSGGDGGAGSGGDGGAEGGDGGAGGAGGQEGVDAAVDAAEPEEDAGEGPPPEYTCGGEATCDLLSEDACDPGEGCQFLVASSGEGAPFAQCVEAGEGASGDACDEDSPCAPGFGCNEVTGNCHKYCCEYGLPDDCPSDQACVVGVDDADGTPTDVLFCDECDECNPLTAEGCEDDEGCYPIPTTGDDIGCRLCLQSFADLEEGEDCEAANECAPGLGCYSVNDAPLACVAFCDLTATPDPCAADGGTCTDELLGEAGMDGEVGLCVPND